MECYVQYLGTIIGRVLSIIMEIYVEDFCVSE